MYSTYPTLLLLCLLSLALEQACGQVPAEEKALPLEAAAQAVERQALPDSGKLYALPRGMRALLLAYPEHILSAKDNTIYWSDGTDMHFDDGQENKSPIELLNAPDLQDQFRMPYPKGKDYLPVHKGQDPGRIRYEPFFRKMYGDSPEEVRKNLRTIHWMPSVYNIPLQVTTVNGVDKKLEAISAELEALPPSFHTYLDKPGGSFNWRKIAGTDRLSMHSFGMTIDINVAKSNYWRWAVKDPQEDGSRPIPYKNRIPLEIVEIFEKHGFIWGGKWYHYDTMHFEYRPELLLLD